MGSGRAPGTIYNHEYFVLCDKRGVVLGLYTDWEVAMDARKPGDYVLTRKEADDARATRKAHEDPPIFDNPNPPSDRPSA